MDIKCIVCGEPWDYSGVITSNDMEKWETKLFQKGYGCPSCEGSPDKFVELEKFSDFENGDDDPMKRLDAYNFRDQNIGKWVKPDNLFLWECDSCGVKVEENANGEYEFIYSKHNLYSLNLNEPSEIRHEIGKSIVCDNCYEECSRCEAPIIPSMSSELDVYDPGWCTILEPYGVYDHYCIDCVGSTCSECNCFIEDCDCEVEDEHTA